MIDEKRIKEKAKKLQFVLAKQIANATKVPVFIADRDKINKLVEGVKKDPEISKNYSEQDLYKEVSDFYVNVNILPPKNKIELDERIIKFIKSLKTKKKYTAYIILRGIFDYPIGLKIGNAKIIKPDLRRKKLMEHIDYLNKNKKLMLQNPSSWNWIKITFESYKTRDIRDILYNELELPYSIISLFSQRGLDVKDNLGIIYSSHKRSYFLEPISPQNGWSKFREDVFLKTLKILSKITNKDKKSNLEKKLLNSLKIYGLSRHSRRLENRFLMLISACESLLLSKNDRDYLGFKLREKTAFLLLKKGDGRRDLYNRMGKFYDMRSRLVHDGETNMSKDDLMYLEDIYLHLIIKMTQLTKKYSKMEKKSNEKDKHGIEDYIECLKFKINTRSLK